MAGQSKILFTFALLSLFTGRLLANQSVSLAWDPSHTTGVAGYFLYYGNAAGSHPSQIDVGTNTVCTLANLQEGRAYYFVVTTYDSARVESLPSNEASFVVPLGTAPQLTAINPGSAPAGSQAFLYGVGLANATSVTFNGISAQFTVSSDTLLLATVPVAAGNGPVTVTTPYGTASVPFSLITYVTPVNDNFNNPQLITGTAALMPIRTFGASKQAGEPNHAGNSGGSSIWYRWTAPVTGTYTLDTAGGDFSALLAVYTGSSVGSLSVVTSNKSSTGYVNAMPFTATAGTTYQIAVDGMNGAAGNMLLRLLPAAASPSVIYSTAFESTSGFTVGGLLSGHDGWQSSGLGGNGILNGLFAGLGQQAYIGSLSLAPGSALALYRPLNYTVNTSVAPVIKFSVDMQVNNNLNLYNDAYVWAVWNAAGHEFFNLCFDNATKMITYSLDNSAGLITTSHTFNNATRYNLVVTMDFAHNSWSATLNGVDLVGLKPLTTIGAGLTLGNIAAKANFKDLLHAGLDSMAFDNYTVTAIPGPAPIILAAPQSQTIAPGDDIYLGVAAVGQPLTFQWYYNNTAITGATNGLLALRNVTSGQGGNYSVVVANSYGSVTSTPAVVTILSNPFPKPMLSSPVAVTGNGVRLNLSLAANSNYRLQASTNLTSWMTLGTYYAYGTNITCFDPDATNYSQRFYRVVSP